MSKPKKRKAPKFQPTKQEREKFYAWWDKQHDLPPMTFDEEAEMIFIAGLRIGITEGIDIGYVLGQEDGPMRIG